MTIPESDDLTDRMKRIETANRIWRIAAVGSILCVLLLLSIGAMPRDDIAKSVETRELILVDDNGRALMRAGVDREAHGRAVLEFFDADGERRIAIGVANNNAPYVALADPASGHGLYLDVQQKQGSALAFRNAHHKGGTLLGAGPEGVIFFGFMDKEGRRRLEMGLNPDGTARITLRSKDDKKAFEIP